jgi:multidrug efflux pump
MSVCGPLIFLNVGVASLNIYTNIGLVSLIGLISKHGILMVDFANKLRDEERLSIHDAITKAAALRLRPILMTTAAMAKAAIQIIKAIISYTKPRHKPIIVVKITLTKIT